MDKPNKAGIMRINHFKEILWGEIITFREQS